MKLVQYIQYGCLLTNFLLSCNTFPTKDSETRRNHTLILKIGFEPAFHENSEIVLFKTDTCQTLKMLLRNDFRFDRSKDTFWFKKIKLSNQEFAILDSSLIRECRQNTGVKENRVLDGIFVHSQLILNGDTSTRFYHSPGKDTDSLGYEYSITLINSLRNIFNDTIVVGYFDDLEGYFDDSKFRRADPKRPIDSLRLRRYNWRISAK